MVVMMMMVVVVVMMAMREVLCAIGCRGLNAREHEPKGENEEDERELHKCGD